MKKYIGITGNPGVAEGRVRVVRTVEDAEKMKEGEVLVVPETSPRLVVPLNIAAAVVTEKSEGESHAAQVAKHLGIPAVIGVRGIMDGVKTGDKVRVDGNSGEVFLLTTVHSTGKK